MIEKLKLNDKEAFNELVILYKHRVINTCYRFLLDKNDAEDISQEVFIEIFQSIKSFKGNSKLSTWIFRIAVTKSLDEIKKRNRKKRMSSLGHLLRLDEISNLISGEKMPDYDLIASDNLKQINKALNQLPDSQRIAFTLSKMDGFSNLEVAEIMNITIIAVESLIYRAKKKVATDLISILKK